MRAVDTAKGACRVLVVDDQKDTAETLAFLLISSGHEATFLTNPLEVEEAVRRIQPHIVFLDIGMPGLNGWEVAALLRRQFPVDSDRLKLVAITAYGTEEARANSRKAGFDAHLTKPVSVQLVEAIIEQLAPGV